MTHVTLTHVHLNKLYEPEEGSNTSIAILKELDDPYFLRSKTFDLVVEELTHFLTLGEDTLTCTIMGANEVLMS